MIDSLNTNEKIKKFVIDFNTSIDFKDNPIITFQFVSLDNAENGDLVWWTFSHNKIKDIYNDCINEFTGFNDGQISRTLIFDDFKRGVYFYFEIGDSIIIEESFDINNYYAEAPKRDSNGITGDSKHTGRAESYLVEWEKILRRQIKSGSTMWISIPHTEIGGTTIIFSSIFIIFNNKIDKYFIDSIYKKIRNFIIDYLIELYDNKSSIRRTKEKLGFDINSNFKPESFKPKKYSGSDESEAKISLGKIEKKYLTLENLNELIEVREIALKVLNSFFDNNEKDREKFFCLEKNKRKRTIYPVEQLMNKSFENFKTFLLARMFFLTMHIVGEYSLKKSWFFLKAYFDFKRGFHKDEMTKCLRIQKTFPDYTDHANINKAHIEDYSKIIPNLSEVEVSLILEIAKNINKKTLISDIESNI